MLTEEEIRNSEPSKLRYKEAIYLRTQFVRYCGPPQDSYFHMIVYLDTFLFCFVSIEELISLDKKRQLNQIPVFKFLKACRNVTAHHSILAAPNQAGQFIRPFSRAISELNLGAPDATAFTRLIIEVERFRQIFSLVALRWPSEQSTLEAAEAYLIDLEAKGINGIQIEEVLREGLEAVATLLGY